MQFLKIILQSNMMVFGILLTLVAATGAFFHLGFLAILPLALYCLYQGAKEITSLMKG